MMRLTRASRALIGCRLSQLELGDSATTMERLLGRLKQLEAAAADGGGERGRHRHCVVNGKLTARRRMQILFDSGKFYEINRLAGYGMEYGDIPAAGSVCGIGRVSGRLCLVTANDATVKGGTVYPCGVKKTLRAQEIASRWRLPVFYLVDSGGAFLPLQSEIFPDAHHGGRTFRNEAVLNAAGIQQLAVVLGSSTAGGAYVPTMCEEVVMTDGVSQVFLGGPPLVRAALGEIVTAEELGGAAMHSRVSGCSDHFAINEESALSTARQMAATLPKGDDESDGCFASPAFDVEELNSLGVNLLPDTARKSAIMAIMARIIDSSHILLFKEEFGDALVCGIGCIGGHRVGLLGSCQQLSERDAVKGSHFIQLCKQRSLPLVFICHCQTDTPVAQPEALKAKARMLAVTATYPLEKICVLVGDAVGTDYWLMSGKSQSPSFLLAWPNARVSVNGLTIDGDGGDAADAFQAAGQLWVDDVITPGDTRQHLSTLLSFGSHYTQSAAAASTQWPVLRM